MIDVINTKATTEASLQFAHIYGKLHEQMENIHFLMDQLERLGHGDWLEHCENKISVLMSDLGAASKSAAEISDMMFDSVITITGKSTISSNPG